MTHSMLVAATALAAALVAGCASSDDAATTDAPATTTDTSADTTAGVKAATWATGVTITNGDGTFTFVSNGIPNHARPAQYALPKDGGMMGVTAANAYAADDPTVAQSYNFTITTRPKKAATTTPTSMGTIGVMVSGATLFNPYEGDGTSIALQSNFTVDGAPFLDTCNGHPTPMGVYHYHGVPHCISDPIDQAGQHAKIVGISFDGFPIYGPNGKGGTVATGLDACNGHSEATGEFPQGIYHYHLTDSAPFSIPCWSGTVDASLTQAHGMGMHPLREGMAPSDQHEDKDPSRAGTSPARPRLPAEGSGGYRPRGSMAEQSGRARWGSTGAASW